MIKASSIKYLSFEGGGGKGIVYLGAIKGLEQKVNGKIGLPLFPLKNTNLDQRKLIGISGSSAGAITAFMLATGMNSREIETEINRIESMPVGTLGTPVNVSPFENFFESPDSNANRIVKGTSRTKDYSNWLSMLVPIGTILTFARNNIASLIANINTSNILLRRIFFSESGGITNPLALNSTIYIHSLLFNRGLFSGFAVRRYFEKLMNNFIARYKRLSLIQPINGYKQAGEVTFFDFFSMTGVDLVVSASNISLHKPKYFSVYHTPNFPVIEAVAISMNFPFIFKPVFVDHTVNRSKDAKYNAGYKGLYVDGGMLNNLPIHAFDVLLEKNDLFYQGAQVTRDVAATEPTNTGQLNKNIVGIRLQEREPPERTEKTEFEPNNFFVASDYISDLLNTFLYAGEEGQIRSEQEREATINLLTDGISIIDFASPVVNYARGESNQATLKELLIRKAENDVKNSLS